MLLDLSTIFEIYVLKRLYTILKYLSVVSFRFLRINANHEQTMVTWPFTVTYTPISHFFTEEY